MSSTDISRKKDKTTTACNCIKLLETYAVMEKNLLKVIDLLQYEKNCLIKEYESKISNSEKSFLDSNLSKTEKIQLLSEELLEQKLTNHELKNRLKLAEQNLKLATLWQTFKRIEGVEEFNCFNNSENEATQNLHALVRNLQDKISPGFETNES